MSDRVISIKGAREHNLKNISLTIPRNKLVVITGLSGSGKSSLAFDTIYAEGQRRYVESLSSYARMFLGRMNKPDLDSIEGLSPAICIDQKTTGHNPRSTVGTVTEIYDYIRLLYARLGCAHCPECGCVIKKQTVDEVIDRILEQAPNRRAYVLSPVVIGKKGQFTKLLDDLRREGFSRVRIDGTFMLLDDDISLKKQVKHTIDVVVDRLVLRTTSRVRIAEACENATKLSAGRVIFYVLEAREQTHQHPDTTKNESAFEAQFSLALACPVHGHSIDELQPRDFSFNAPYGACPDCDGLGSKRSIDVDEIIEDPRLSVAEGVFGGVLARSNYYSQILDAVCNFMGASSATPYKDLSDSCQHALLYGLGSQEIPVRYHTKDGRINEWKTTFPGVCDVLFDKYQETTSETMKQHFAKFIKEVPCTTCKGARLKPEYLAVTVGDKNIQQLCELSCAEALCFVQSLHFDKRLSAIAQPLLKEIRTRLEFMVHVGLDYLTLARSASTLSGGEAQRIRLATQIGSGLTGVLYILDEPSIGLHQKDNDRLITTLKQLRDQGNTVIVVEHDEDTIRAADYVIDMGPGAGELGGDVIAQGTPSQIMRAKHSLTADYLVGRRKIVVPHTRRKGTGHAFTLSGAAENNLQNIEVSIPYGTFTVVTGVSGSGKSSLVTDTVAPLLAHEINHSKQRIGAYKSFSGLYDSQHKSYIDKVINIDQSPIGRTPRSNPATYIGLWDDLRALFASLPDSRARGYSAGRFSFNVSGGRCEACKGDGQLKIEMNFLPDVYVPCEVCHGRRYNRETLEICYKGKSISDVLDMTVHEALAFFASIPKISRKLQTLYDVGLGYIHLGQSATTLSGGEAQRVKLSRELHRQQTGKTFYILDEPTTGLHFEDVRMLIEVLQKLVDAGNTVVIIEHNLDVIKVADYLIDLGPLGGARGGNVIATGTPEELAACEKSYTGLYLKRVLPAKA